MSTLAKKIKVCSFSDWRRAGIEIFSEPVSPIVGKYNDGLITIVPSVTRHADVTILGGAFIPVLSNGDMLLEQAIHTPSLFFRKKQELLIKKNDEIKLISRPVINFHGQCILIGGSSNYYHWIVDYLPRLLLCMKLFPVKEYKLLINSHPMSFQIETLTMLGIDSASLVYLDNDKNYQIQDLIFPGLLASTTLPHPMIKQLFSAAFPLKIKLRNRRVYFARDDAASRRFINEVELQYLLKKYDFEIVVPGRLSVREQIEISSAADVLLAAHGAALANIVFCSEGASIVEIFTLEHKVTSMQLLASSCRLKHVFVPAKNCTYGADGNPLLGDWSVDLDELELVLDRLCA